MSHLTIQTRVNDPTAIAAACRRLGLAAPVQGTVQLYSGAATGLIVQLPDWQFPIVIDTSTGDVRYDNYGGAWGTEANLHKFLQLYAVERARSEAHKKGYAVSETTLTDGSIRLQIQEG